MKELIFASILVVTFSSCILSYLIGVRYGKASERLDACRRWQERQARWREFDDI
jgi:hypothetical protein